MQNKPEGVIPSYKQIEEWYKSGAITADQVKTLSQRRKALDDFQANMGQVGEWGRQLGGAALTALGALPILNGPVTGAIGGAVTGLGQGIQRHSSGKEVLDDMGKGALAGLVLGSAGKLIPKRSAATALNQNMTKRIQPPVTSPLKPFTAKTYKTVPVEDALKELESSTDSSTFEYLTKYAPEFLPTSKTASLGPYLLTKYSHAGDLAAERAGLARKTIRNDANLYYNDRAFGVTRPSMDEIRLAPNNVNEHGALTTWAHEGLHDSLAELEARAKGGDEKAFEYIEKLKDFIGSNRPPSYNEIVPRAAEGLTNPNYRPNSNTLNYYGGDMDFYNEAVEFLRPDYNEALYRNLLRRTGR